MNAKNVIVHMVPAVIRYTVMDHVRVPNDTTRQRGAETAYSVQKEKSVNVAKSDGSSMGCREAAPNATRGTRSSMENVTTLKLV